MLARSYSLSSRTAWLIGAILTAFWLAIYLITVSPTVNFIDSGELITALHEPGIAHPPGYPLYTLLGYVVSRLPLGEVAWRVNLFSAFWGSLAVGALYLLLITLGNYAQWLAARRAALAPPRRKASKSTQAAPQQPPNEQPRYNLTVALAAVAAASLLGAAATFWNRSIQAKMYTLHYFFVLFLFWLAIMHRQTYERGDSRASRRYLIALAAALGLSFTNHLTTSLLVPGLAILLLAGSGWRNRLLAILRHWTAALPALLLPLLLYLYLPLRSSQGPIMDWGSPTTLPDFWRHITGWQYTAYLQHDPDAWKMTAQLLWTYATGQWGWLTWLVFALCLVSAPLLARANLPIFLATLTTALLTIAFALQYGISEIEPYLVPVYAMLMIWLGTAPPLIDGFAHSLAEQGQTKRPQNLPQAQRYALPAVTVLLIVALVSTILQFPRQNHSNDHLAELFSLNILNNLEKDSIIITDHWDFQAPSYYMQLVRGARPDVTIIGKSLLRYPWYLEELQKRHPWLIANSKDIADTFSREQRKWVNGERFNSDLLQNSYIGLLTSFVERNISTHPAYVFFSSQCDPSLAQQGEEGNLIAQNYTRQVSGVAYRLWPQPPPATSLPPQPNFDLRGYTYDKTPLDDFAKVNASCYANAYALTAQAFAGANNPSKAQELASKAAQLRQLINEK